MNLSGSELRLNEEGEGSSMQYVADWDTRQRTPNRRATRSHLHFAIQVLQFIRNSCY